MSKLVNDLIRRGYLKSDLIIDAFSEVDRVEFVPGEFEKISFCPESVVVTSASVLILGKLTVSIELVAHGSSCGVPAVDEIVEGVDIFS